MVTISLPFLLDIELVLESGGFSSPFWLPDTSSSVSTTSTEKQYTELSKSESLPDVFSIVKVYRWYIDLLVKLKK